MQLGRGEEGSRVSVLRCAVVGVVCDAPAGRGCGGSKRGPSRRQGLGWRTHAAGSGWPWGWWRHQRRRRREWSERGERVSVGEPVRGTGHRHSTLGSNERGHGEKTPKRE